MSVKDCLKSLEAVALPDLGTQRKTQMIQWVSELDQYAKDCLENIALAQKLANEFRKSLALPDDQFAAEIRARLETHPDAFEVMATGLSEILGIAAAG